MSVENLSEKKLEIKPVTPERWNDLEQLFGPTGGCEGCWCMWWRIRRADFSRLSRPERKEALHQLVDTGNPPGLLAYHDGQPVGWCSLAPREEYEALERSKKLQRIDDLPVWSVVCFFVARKYRRSGIATELLKAAVAYAQEHGATVIEGYPVDPHSPASPAAHLYMGTVAAFQKAGFGKVPSESGRVMRYFIEQKE